MLPNTQAIPADLAARFAPVIERTLTGRVRLRRPDQVAVRDEVTGKTTFTPAAPYYDGPARIQARPGGPPATNPSDRVIASTGYLVAVPHTVVDARPFDVVEVVDGGDDPGMAGLVLVVDQVASSTVILQRNLTCNLHDGAAAGT